MLAGCVQPVLTPNTNAATARILDRLGIELLEMKGANAKLEGSGQTEVKGGIVKIN